MSYHELHARSAFSFLRGASQPEELAAEAARLGLPAVALCDRDGVYGTARFHAACREHGVRAIVGAELTLEDGAALPVLVESRTGYRNLCQLITRAQLRAEKGHARVRYDELAAAAPGLCALTGTPTEGPLALAWQRGGRQAMERVAAKLATAFPGSLYCELHRHQVRGEAHWHALLRDLAAALRLPLLASNAPSHATPDGRRVLDVFTCLREKTTIDAAGRLLSLNASRHLRGPQDMTALFADLPEAIANTARLAARCQFSLENLGYEFPRYHVPQGETMDSFLRKIAWFGAEHRFGSITPPVRRQIEHELRIIGKLGFSGYFLIVWDIVNFCREEGIMVQGRGSAANSAVCYALGITAVDPIAQRLLFERFLSENRKGWPDIDLDLPSGDRRERVIQEVYRRYGKHGAAMTANVITYRGRSTIRELGKVLGFPEEALNRFSSLYGSGDYPHSLDLQAHLERSGIQAAHPRTAALADLYQRIHRLPRHLGQHSGGMVICQDALSSVVPLENASMPGRVVVQWDKDDCEDLGIVKVDLLGLGMMAVLQDALEITRQRGHPVDLARIPKDDPKTFDLMCAADTIGVFQIESRAQMATLPRMQPRCFYDVAIEVAIIRPGPIQGNMVNPYLERRAGRQPVDYIHPRLEPVLERTLGVCLFQEQILQIAMIMAGFTGSDAEDLRRALNFSRDDSRLRKASTRLAAALDAHGVEPAARDKIVASLQSFALYGFPESHAISFALLAYGSAYLKAHYPAEFYTGLLNNQPMGFYSPSTLIQDARRHGVTTRPPCVATSEWECTVETDARIRLGLLHVRGLNHGNAAAMLAERHRAPFRNLRDFMLRTRFSREERRALAAAGALNTLGTDRRGALWAVEEDVDPDSLFALAELQGTGGDGLPGAPPPLADDSSPLPPMSYLERIQADYEQLGLTTGSHPMRLLRDRLNALAVYRAADLPLARNGQHVTIAGNVICRQRPGTAKGFVFISLEDETGVANAIVTPALFEHLRLTIVQEPALIIAGPLQLHEGTTLVKARTIQALDADALPAGQSYDFH